MIAKTDNSGSSGWTIGQSGAQYTLTVSNTGTAATSGTITVTDTLPTGLSFTGGASGTGWVCGITGGGGVPALSCKSTTVIVSGSSGSPITFTVAILANTPGKITNTAQAYGGGDLLHATLASAARGSDSTTVHGSQTLSYTGAAQTFTVPAGVTQIIAKVVGAAGYQFGLGGPGEDVIATLPVTSGETLNVYAGGSVSGFSSAGGFNGGGAGCMACGGGGASDIREGGTALNDRIIVSGGGGGVAFLQGYNRGGAAGFFGGSPGQDVSGFPGSGGGGGTQTVGGSAGTISGSVGSDGSAGALGVGGSGVLNSSGGGGGGYYGGGGGAFDSGPYLGGGGGGGSSFVESSATSVSFTYASQAECDTSNDGCVAISW